MYTGSFTRARTILVYNNNSSSKTSNRTSASNNYGNISDNKSNHHSHNIAVIIATTIICLQSVTKYYGNFKSMFKNPPSSPIQCCEPIT